MKVLVLGGTGYIGSALLNALEQLSWAEPSGASRGHNRLANSGVGWIKLDTLDAAALTTSLKGFDAVVNCVAGDGRSIDEGARNLAASATDAGCRRLIHLSTMSVYGDATGWVGEDYALVPQTGWYAEAKRQAESHIKAFASNGGEAVILRPGCVFGPGSDAWVGRTARWLRAGRLGDIGAAGDGWSNLVHIDDVCRAVLLALQAELAPGDAPAFNLAAPDSPRWNRYFVDLALSIGATPVKRIGSRQLKMDSLLCGPPLKIAEKLLKAAGYSTRLPDPISPTLVRLWAQQIRLDPTLATRHLGLGWTPYAEALASSVRHLNNQTKILRQPLPKAMRQLIEPTSGFNQ